MQKFALIYPKELDIKKTNTTFLDIYLKFDINGLLYASEFEFRP